MGTDRQAAPGTARRATGWPWGVLLAAAFWLMAPAGRAEGLLDLGAGDESEDLFALLGQVTENDLDRLGMSHLSMLRDWDHVQPASARAALRREPYHWREVRKQVRPLGGGEICAWITVPEAGAYRVSLRHRLRVRAACPVTLALAPQKVATAVADVEEPAATNGVRYVDAGPGVSHTFGAFRLAGARTGAEQEKVLPVRFERETDLISVPRDTVMAWEHWDVELAAGVYRAALSSDDPQVEADALFLSQSRDFRPSFAAFEGDRTLGRLYMRFRVTPRDVAAGSNISANAGLGYHWRGRRLPGATEDCWYWTIGQSGAFAPGAWSPFLEATEAIVPGPGPWSTCRISLRGVKQGDLEVQFAWSPHESAVQQTVTTGVGGGAAMLRTPNGSWSQSPRSGVPAWGMWNEEVLARIQTQEAVIERYFVWAREAADRLGLPEDHPRPRHIRLFSGCGVNAPHRERAAEMLAKLGINWINGAPESIVRKYGLHDERSAYNTANAAGLAATMSEADRRKLTKVKIGDEIATLMPAARVNRDVGKRAAFHDYLREQARREGLDLRVFLGTEDVEDLDCMGTLPPDAGRFERRLYYCSHRFCHLATCDGYRALTGAFERHFPNVRVYNNYSPHPVFLTGTTMNHGDWFVLPRHKAQTMGWAEDWATGGSWGLHTGHQCTSFYAALVDCAVRKHGYPSGFYVGVNCGAAARKIFACVAQGLTVLHLYDWGPIDRWAEGSNAWSEHRGEYYNVMCAAHAIGPADEIIAKGEREVRRTAILYNRSHEIMSGGSDRLNHDWMWTFIGLKSSQIPVDVIIEEDLNPGDLAGYDCVILGGYNLARYHLAALRAWVEAGGLLIGAGGAAVHDIYDDPMDETVSLFGARQRRPTVSYTGSVATVTFPESAFFPATELKRAGATFLLEPMSGHSLASYEGGACAAVVNTVGKGHALLLGFQPGFAFRDNGRAMGEVRRWLAAPVLKRLGRQRLEFDYSASEATLFEHPTGIAVTLADFGRASPESGSRLCIRTDREVREVISALHGPLPWRRVGDRIEVDTPQLAPVDVVILR